LADDTREDVLFDPEEKQVFKTEEFEGPLDLLLYQIQKSTTYRLRRSRSSFLITSTSTRIQD